MEEIRQSRLRDYGTPVAEYTGEGTIHWATSPPQRVVFDAGQLHDGQSLVVCSSPLPMTDALLRYFGGGDEEQIVRFEGVTAEARSVNTVGHVDTINYLPNTKEPGAYTTLRVRQLDVTFSTEPVAQHRFGLVNFHVSGTHAVTVVRPDGTHYVRGVPAELRIGDRRVNAMIVPIADADSLHRQVITSKDFRVLSEVIVPVDVDCDGTEFTQAMADLCLVLSVARGTRVQWVYREDWSDATLVRRSHRSYLTKQYCPLAPIPEYVEYAEATQRFITQALDALPTRNSFLLERGTIAVYLDAKAENDYMQIRGAKIAVAIERLKDVFLKVPESGVREFVMPESQFQQLVPQLSTAIKSVLPPELSSDVVQQVAGESRLLMLNRTGFRRVLKALCRYVGFTPDKGELELFLMSRDYLVHTGEFYCDAAKPEDRERVPPLPDPTWRCVLSMRASTRTMS